MSDPCRCQDQHGELVAGHEVLDQGGLPELTVHIGDLAPQLGLEYTTDSSVTPTDRDSPIGFTKAG